MEISAPSVSLSVQAMKPLDGLHFLKAPFVIKTLAFVSISIAFFYIGNRWSVPGSGGYQRIIFFSPTSASASARQVSFSPNLGKSFNLSAVISHGPEQSIAPSLNVGATVSAATALTAAPPPPQIAWVGIVNENGTMSDDFDVEEYDSQLVDDWKYNESEIDTTAPKEGDGGEDQISIKSYQLCSESMKEYIPCLDNVEAVKNLNSTRKGEQFERHCPAKDKGLDCLVPPPRGYRRPIPWPKSRDEVWFNNVPHTRLVEDKGGQNWIYQENDKFKFPGGGTQFIHGADQYLDQIEKMVPDITFGRHIRVVLDVGCGVASFGAYLMSRNVITMSIAPKDVHENQIQFALERGVPAMVAAFATRRLLYPSQAFDMIHCSRCKINWTSEDGILLLEVNRLLRAGGYFAWAAQPVYKHEPSLEEQWEEMFNLTTRLCWELVKKEGYIAIWKKPLNNTCYLGKEASSKPRLCEPDDDPDNVWYTDLKACITWLPENGYGVNITEWPARLQNPPGRLQTIQIDAVISRNELFRAESKYWNDIIASYANGWKQMELRNVLDMKAGFGGFAAALAEQKFDFWVLNVVPVSGPNTLPVIYDRGLIGVMHDWCEPFDTYPRTYDLLHAAGLFSVEKKRCNMSTILLEMDRILRPGGHVYIRDSITVMDKLQEISNAMGWNVQLHDTYEGPHASYRILICEKRLLQIPEIKS
ncbi:hypothetical protein SAY86_024648 [Trapa natans]|uniref:Methyltransferase n=1 Tax=Trapa natans TaxID=22666 RepID=A0AAN7MV97_TRANT|nr:hypothetical protein SAY86_024648 [Trapa natans]